jgi:hypothetical protein
MNDNVYLIFLETSGNQAYIYSSNKLRDVVGASELIYRTGTLFVQQAIDWTTGRQPDIETITTGEPKIEEIDSSLAERVIEIVIATSGKAVLLADSKETAKDFIAYWSKIITQEAPGIDAIAVYSGPLDLTVGLEAANGYMPIFREAREKFSMLKSERPSGLSRFQRIPIAAPCNFSTFPAEGRDTNGNRVSVITKVKLNARNSNDFTERIGKLFRARPNTAIAKNGLEGLEGLDWLAVAHSDGNGLGQIFMNFHICVQNYVEETQNRKATGRDYVDCYRKFSAALDRISEKAFYDTVSEIWKEHEEASIVPIVVGGDDLTVVLDGKKGVIFTKRYMENFCTATASQTDVTNMLRHADPPSGRLGMCGGICIAKPHFPFSASYRLAEELMQKAKAVKTKVNSESIALDFHILYDSVAASLEDIRKKLHIRDENAYLTSKPFAVGVNDADCGNEDSKEWSKLHNYERFEAAVKAIASVGEDGRRLLPSSQAHAVREAFFSEHRETQEADWEYLMKRYDEFAEAWRSVENAKKLYAGMGEEYFTYFLDALEAADFVRDPHD